MSRTSPPGAAPGKDLPPAAVRALEEAEARRAERAAEAEKLNMPPEVNGPKGAEKGAEPTRYGDWERDGRAFDFS